jgi:hypothetical protein
MPSGGSRRPETKSKKSCPSSAVLKTKVDVRKTGGLTAPSELRIVAVVQHQSFGMKHVVADVGLRRKRFDHGCLAVCLVLGPRKLRDVVAGILQRDKRPAVGQRYGIALS